jgi:DNA-binding MarR family transcriptional regulator
VAGKPGKTRANDDRLDLDGFIPYRLSVMQQEVSRAIARVYAEKHDLMRHDWRVMAALGGGQPLSANEVCQRTNMDKVQVSRAIARLKQKGLVTQHRDAGDRRRSSLRLTKPGESIYRDIVPAARAREAELLSVLGATELKQLDKLIEKLYRRARDLNSG